MSIQNIRLKKHHYRYSFYKNSNPRAPFGIFLMGNLQEIESVSFFSNEFAKHLNLFVVEIPGTGLTEPLPATFTIQDQAAMLVDFVDHMDINNAHVLAFSYATPVALEFCSNWSGTESLSMCGGMAGIPEESRFRTMAILSDAIRDRSRFAEEFISGLTVNDKNIPRGKVIARSARQKVLKYTDKQISCFCENTLRILSYRPSENIKNLLAPSIVFIGDKDPYVTESNARKLASILLNCQFAMIENADHLVHLEKPEKTAELMIHLVRRYSNQRTTIINSATAA